ncbi:CbtA family protein [Hahella ganghwensis]|uniref:CbtA family protein n=1 Tax=Hahella ganghwensis TaxID=286420 RepID=UPI00036D77DF|nr:CbtA family protein [Hahella ganghwensis]
MIFRRIILNALFVGLLAGLFLSAAQMVGVAPIIFAAEEYELPEGAPVADSSQLAAHSQEATGDSVHSSQSHQVSTENHHGAESHSHENDHHSSSHGHSHGEDAWAPEDGAERTSYTLVSNIMASIGFAAVLLALMAQFQSLGITRINPVKGLYWGVAGFLAFFAAPGIGLPPEIPGIEAAPLSFRQEWWILTVIATGVGLAVLAFTPIKWKALGLVAIVVPFIIGAPHNDGPEFSHPDAGAVEALSGLHHDFIIASSLANLLFWVALGLLSAWVLNRRVLKDSNNNVAASA